MRNYEMMFIVKTSAEGEGAKKISESYKKVVTDNKGKVTELKDLGQKKLAYPIKKELNGFYYVMLFSADSDTITELDRRLRLDESILRHMIIRLEEE